MVNTVNEVKRGIKREVERVLWARAGGRCQFSGCNRLLYKSPITEEPVNVSEKAHVYSFSEKGPRGWGPFSKNRSGLNDVHNLMLMCHDCHKLIDQDKLGEQYSGKLLLGWKHEHEARITLVTGIDNAKKSHILFYSAKIGTGIVTIHKSDAFQALFPEKYPATEKAIDLSMEEEEQDHDDRFWEIEANNLEKKFRRLVVPLVEEAEHEHFSVFSIAPQPLLILLGTLLTDRLSTDVYQLHREPQTWSWLDEEADNTFEIAEPRLKNKQPVLVISISARIDHDRITEVIGDQVSVWEIYAEKTGNDILRTKEQLKEFRITAREVLSKINTAEAEREKLLIFPAMPVSCAVELGRVRMPKADLPWKIYDQNIKSNGFMESVSIGEDKR